MKHTDFFKKYQQLDEQVRAELSAAIKAHGGEYIFIHTEDEDEDSISTEKTSAPVICASTKWLGGFEDFYVTSLSFDKNNQLRIYGFPTEGYVDEEQELTEIAHGHLEYIIDLIPETDEVQDVTIS